MSQWDKLLKRILTLSKDLRFDELRRVLENYGYEMNTPRAGAVITHSANPDASRLPFQNMNPSKRFMSKWSDKLLKVRCQTMKTIDEYLALPYRMEIVPDTDEGGFVVSFPDLPGCITCGETMESAIANAQDAKAAWLTVALEDGIEIQEPDSLDAYSGQFKLRLPKSLHRSLSEHSKREGVSMNQYCVYLLARNDALAQAQ